MADVIQNPAPPNLPLGPVEYERRYQDQYSNVLRLYFNRLQNALSTLFGTRGGRFLNFPLGAYQNNSDVTLAAINTPTLVPLPITDFQSGMYAVVGDGVHVQQAGIYNYQFSIQFRNTDTQIHDAYFWLRINGVDAPWTGSAASVTSRHGGVDGFMIVAANFFIELQDGDYVEMWWAANSTQISMHSIAATSSHYVRPGSPSVVVTLSFVSNLVA